MDPRLIVLNGPPGIGKSTLARHYVHEHPLALDLDIDLVRSLMGGWREHLAASGTLARAVVLAGARAHLTAGHDVIIPQYLGRLGFIEEAERLAAEVGAEFHEVVLIDSAPSAADRFQTRFAARGEPGATSEELAEMYDRLLGVVAGRPATKLVRSEPGEIDRTYRTFVEVLSR